MNETVWSPEEALDQRGWVDRVGPSGDELDKLAVDEIRKRVRLGNAVSAIDIDCGDGGQALRMAAAGARVLATHPDDVCPTLRGRAEAAGVAGQLHCQHFNPWRIEALAGSPLAPFDVVVSHRTLSFMRHAEALVFVRHLLAMTRIGGRLFFSAFGLHSEFGDDYPDRNVPVGQRFSPLAAELGARYDLPEPVCLYTERDLFLLMFSAGISVIKTFTTTHGSVKVVGVRV